MSIATGRRLKRARAELAKIRQGPLGTKSRGRRIRGPVPFVI